MATRGALAKSELDIAYEEFEKYPLELRKKYVEIGAAPNSEELLSGLGANEQYAFLRYLLLVNKIEMLVAGRVKQSHSKPVTFAAPNPTQRTVIMDTDSEEEASKDEKASKRWSL